MSNGQWATLDLWEDRHREQIARIEALEAKLAQAVEALEAIYRRAAPHPDDDDNERKRQLVHIHSKASATISTIKREAE